jgi:hypothetical protein
VGGWLAHVTHFLRHRCLLHHVFKLWVDISFYLLSSLETSQEFSLHLFELLSFLLKVFNFALFLACLNLSLSLYHNYPFLFSFLYFDPNGIPLLLNLRLPSLDLLILFPLILLPLLHRCFHEISLLLNLPGLLLCHLSLFRLYALLQAKLSFLITQPHLAQESVSRVTLPHLLFKLLIILSFKFFNLLCFLFSFHDFLLPLVLFELQHPNPISQQLYISFDLLFHFLGLSIGDVLTVQVYWLLNLTRVLTLLVERSALVLRWILS